jgi:hypothetical protein
VLVLWLREEAFDKSPLVRLAYLLEQLTPQDAPTAGGCDVRLMGPRTSTTLDSFYADAGNLDVRTRRRLEQVRAFSPTATAAPDVLPHKPDAAPLATSSGDGSGADGVAAGCLSPVRVMLSDDRIAATLVAELFRRGIDLRPPTIPRPAPGAGAAAGAASGPPGASAGQPASKPDTAFVEQGVDDPQQGAGDKPHVALVAEWDTFYGRALPFTFAAATSGRYTAKQMMDDPAKVPPYIHHFIYQRGIDGRVAGADAAPPPSGDGAGAGAQAAPRGWSAPLSSYAETPEGTNQLDYVRRLAHELEQTDRRLFRERGEGLRAVGVLGSDLYDTLLILRALRGLLPHAVFFTTTLDARLAHPAEWQAAHNLVVVTGYGLALHPYYQRNVPPFRDTNQTATFAATLAASDVFGPGAEVFGKLLRQPRIFEIGRRGPHDLSVDRDAAEARQVPLTMTLESAYPNGPGTLHPYRPELAGWWTARRAGWLVALLLAAFLGMGAFLFLVLKFNIRMLQPGLLLSHPLPFTIVALGAVVALLWGIYAAQVVEGEPFALVGGISVWPTVAVRLLVGLACIHFMFRNGRLTRKNDRKIKTTFFEPAANAGGGAGGVAGPRRTLRQWIDVARERAGRIRGWIAGVWRRGWKRRALRAWVVGAWDRNWEVMNANGTKVDAALVWKEYLRHSGKLDRLLRATMMAAAYLVFVGCLMQILGAPTSPARGNLCRWLDRAATYLWAVPLGTLLTFFAIDATMINTYFIKHLTRSDTEWPPHAYEQCTRRGLTNDELSDYLDIRLIAMRTEVVGRLVYMPLLVVFLLITSHASYFDNWDWPAGTVAAYAVSVGCSLVSALILRRAAEQARADALDRMRDRWICYLGKDDPKANAMEQLVDEVKAERRGAFSILSQYPFFAALLLPSGGLGVWVLIEYLATHHF